MQTDVHNTLYCFYTTKKMHRENRAALNGWGPGQFLVEGAYDVIHDIIVCKSCVFAD